MERYQKELTRIKELLKTRPRGMTVTEIAKAIGINRNSVAKYLDVLLISGHVEMKTFGPAKVYFLSQRVPISALLNFSSDYILVTDQNLKIVQANDNLLELIKLEREALLGQLLEDVVLPLFTGSELSSTIKEALDGKDATMELKAQRNDTELYFRTKFIPTTFDDGSPGITLLLENITKTKKATEQLAWESSVNATMAELARALIQPESLEDISDLVLDYAKRLTDSKFGFVAYIDPETGYLISTTLTKDIWEDCQVPDKDIVFKEFRGLWGWVLEHYQPILTNSPTTDPRSTGIPPGHIPIQKFLSVPAVIGEMLVGQVAIANSERNYTKRDLGLVERLATLYALAVQRKRNEEMLEKRAHDLEE